MVAIAMLVAGFVVDQNDRNLAVNTLNKLIHLHRAPDFSVPERHRQR